MSRFGKNAPFAQRVASFCRDALDLANATTHNGLTIPDNLSYRKNHKRIVIQPTSAREHKNWLPNKFLKLAEKLQKHGWHPVFCVAPNEYSTWHKKIKSIFPLLKSNDLKQVAAFIYESGFVIGNDSGIGHLASNLQIPSLTIYRRLNQLFLWRPGWFINNVVTPPFKMPFFHRYTWKHMLYMKRALKAFYSLVAHASYL